TLNNPQYIPGDFWAVDTTYAVIPKENIHAKWLYFSLCNSRLELLNEATGVPSINRDRLFRIPVQDIDLLEQTRIAYVLDTIDEAIAKIEAVIEKLKQVRAGMLHDLLNYGLDEHGQLRDPIAHPEQFKESPLGLIPKDWGFGPFSEIAIVNPPKPVIRISPVSTISFIPMQDIDEEGNWIYRQTKKLIDCGVGYTPFIDGDVLFAKITPCMENGKGCHARNLVNGYGLGSTEFHVLRSKTNSSDRFVFHWSMTKRMRTKALAYMTGSAGQQRVEAGFFSLFDIPIPPFGEQNLIANQLDETDKQIETSRKELSKIKAVRIGIQDDLLTGRVRVPETVSFQESKQ
ncbi:MAG: hypothetical protein FJZ98_10365, partial [Chloroflexi bacterium]|nr:hypothetical protein [Chloroflexota bacterium]